MELVTGDAVRIPPCSLTLASMAPTPFHELPSPTLRAGRVTPDWIATEVGEAEVYYTASTLRFVVCRVRPTHQPFSQISRIFGAWDAPYANSSFQTSCGLEYDT